MLPPRVELMACQERGSRQECVGVPVAGMSRLGSDEPVHWALARSLEVSSPPVEGVLDAVQLHWSLEGQVDKVVPVVGGRPRRPRLAQFGPGRRAYFECCSGSDYRHNSPFESLRLGSCIIEGASVSPEREGAVAKVATQAPTPDVSPSGCRSGVRDGFAPGV